MKSHLKKTLNTALITYEEFITIIVEIELTMNSRPLTYISDDLYNYEPLTPSHLLVGYSLNALPIPEELLDQDTTFQDPIKVNKRYKYILSLISKFKDRFEKDYLVNLRQSWNSTGNFNIRVGDVVQILGNGPLRLKCKLGIVKKLFTSPDGHVRSVTLKTSGGETSRSIVHLVPLEIHSNIFDDMDKDISDLSNNEPFPKRTKRQASLKARKQIKMILDNEKGC